MKDNILKEIVFPFFFTFYESEIHGEKILQEYYNNTEWSLELWRPFEHFETSYASECMEDLALSIKHFIEKGKL